MDLIKHRIQIEDIVTDILLCSPDARTNDNTLIFLFWAREAPEMMGIWYKIGSKVKLLTPAETITRIRRKLNEKGKFVSPATRELRKQRSEDIARWAKQ